MTREELAEKISSFESSSALHYAKSDEFDNLAEELRDVLEDWGDDEDIEEPDADDFGANNMDDYHFESLAYSEAQDRLSAYPDKIAEILKRAPSESEEG